MTEVDYAREREVAAEREYNLARTNARLAALNNALPATYSFVIAGVLAFTGSSVEAAITMGTVMLSWGVASWGIRLHR